MRTLPKELVEAVAGAMFRSRHTTPDWYEVCRDNPDMADEVCLLACAAINATLDYLSNSENATGLVLAPQEPTASPQPSNAIRRRIRNDL